MIYEDLCTSFKKAEMGMSTSLGPTVDMHDPANDRGYVHLRPHLARDAPASADRRTNTA